MLVGSLIKLYQIVPSYTDELWNSETRVCRLYYIYIIIIIIIYIYIYIYNLIKEPTLFKV